MRICDICLLAPMTQNRKIWLHSNWLNVYSSKDTAKEILLGPTNELAEVLNPDMSQRISSAKGLHWHFMLLEIVVFIFCYTLLNWFFPIKRPWNVWKTIPGLFPPVFSGYSTFILDESWVFKVELLLNDRWPHSHLAKWIKLSWVKKCSEME